MQNLHDSPDLLIERLRLEIQKRKRGLDYDETTPTEPDRLANISVTHEQPLIPLSSPAHPAAGTTAGKPRVKSVQRALDRASAKNQAHRKWPRLLRGLRRNQETVNESLINGIHALLDTLEWLREKFKLLEAYLTDVAKRVDQQARWAREFERVALEREHQLDRRSLLNQDRQTQIDAHLAELKAFVREQERQAIALQNQFKDQQDQWEDRQALLAGQQAQLQQFTAAQQLQTIEEHRQLQELQERLAGVLRNGEEHREKISGFLNQAGRLETQVTSLTARAADVERMRNKVNGLQASMAILESHLLKTKGKASPLSSGATKVLGEKLEQHKTDTFYLAFEDQFRGSRELVKERLRFYLPAIEQAKAETDNVLALDLGCGRGEWLELLQENGYEGEGVDLNICMVEECTSRRLKAHYFDAIEYLRAVPSESLALVTGFHLVEHLEFAQFYNLINETLRVLRIRGVAIFETPNPESAKVSLYSFFLDPTHRHPIPQELLCFAAIQAGFKETKVERLQEHLEDGVSQGYLDYGAILRK